MVTSHLIWAGEFSSDHAGFSEPKVLADADFFGGRSMVAEVPPRPIVLEQRSGTGRQLPDFLETPWCLLVSAALRATLERRGVGDLEYFDVELRNTKGRVLSEEHAILNVLAVVDCIDEGASEFTVSPFRKRFFNTMSRIVLEPAKIPEDRLLFRLDRFPEILIARGDLAEEVGAKHTGCRFRTLADYNDEYRKEW